MLRYKKDINVDRLIEVINNDYNSSKDALSLMLQNILGFSMAIAIQAIRKKVNTDEDIVKALLHSSFWYFFIDNLIINRRRKKYAQEKKEAFENIHILTNTLKELGINVEETDVLHSIKERINRNIDYYYMIDMFNNIVPVSKTKGKTITWGEGIDGYNHISFEVIGSIVTDKEGISKTIEEKEIENRQDYVEIKTFYDLAYKQDEDMGIITFCRENDDIIIIYTEGDIDKKSEKEKYLKIGLLLQSIDYKNSYEINGILKQKIKTVN